MRYNYLVYYIATKDNRTITGTQSVSRDTRIRKYDCLQEIMKGIQEYHGLDSLAITNIQKFPI